MNDEISRPLKIHRAASAAAPTARITSRMRKRRIDHQIYSPCLFKCPARNRFERYPEKAKRTTFADRPIQSKREVVRSIIGTTIEQIGNFVYAEKQKCQSTLTNQNHAVRR